MGQANLLTPIRGNSPDGAQVSNTDEPLKQLKYEAINDQCMHARWNTTMERLQGVAGLVS